MHKTSITLRVDPTLLAAVRDQAQAENRTVTNFIETVLKERLAGRGGESRHFVAHEAQAEQRGEAS